MDPLRTNLIVRPSVRRLIALLLVAAATLGAERLVAQQISARGADIRLGGRLHAQYAHSSVEAAENDFFFRRARLIADITVSDFLDARLQTDVAGGRAAVQDAYLRFEVVDGVRVSMGQFKRAFDLFELSSSTDLSIIERDGRVEGIGSCTGVGGVCSYSRLTERLDFAGRDAGLRVDGSSGKVTWMATVTNGTGANTADENDAKSLSGRVVLAATENVRVGFQAASHDYVGPMDTDRAGAWGADVEVGSWRSGFHLQAAVAGGDNWSELDALGNAAAFRALQVVGSFYHPLDDDRWAGVEPLLRVSIADPDTGMDDDAATILTPGLMLYVSGRNKVGINVDVFSPQMGDTEYSFKLQSFLYF